MSEHDNGRSIPRVQASMGEPLARYGPTGGSSTTSIGWACSSRAIVVAHGGTHHLVNGDARTTV